MIASALRRPAARAVASTSGARLLSNSVKASLAQPASASSSSSSSGSSSLSPASVRYAQDLESKYRGTSTSGGTTKNYVDGQFVDSRSDRWIDVHDPVSVSTRVHEVSTARSSPTLDRLRKPC